MLDELTAKVTAAELLAFTPRQRQDLLLKMIAQRALNGDPIAAKYVFRGEIEGLYPFVATQSAQRSHEADDALMEAWQSLLSSGLIMQAPGQSEGMITLTARGREVVKSDNFSEMGTRMMLTKDMLHRDLQSTVFENFASGNYETAVRDAFVTVEIEVRSAANLPATTIGVRLMRDAFNVNGGPLTDTSLPLPERERIIDLFVGAIGTFKNAASHRKLTHLDALTTIEELMIASRLLRFFKP
jgi:uncharacterized protein (TIGR02391 family)